MIYRKRPQDSVSVIRAALGRARRLGAAAVLFVLAAWWLGSAAQPQSVAVPVAGQVERVIDGDTLKVVEPDGRLRTLRLLGVDAPESGQAGGDAAREFVAARVCHRKVVWHDHGEDRYRRTVASVEVDGEDIGVRLVEAGLAWRVKRYLEPAPAAVREAYEDAWRAARAARIGLWAGDPQPPWEWRRTHRPTPGLSIACGDWPAPPRP